MATTVGLVQKITWVPPAAAACFWIGPSAQSAEIFFVLMASSDTEAESACKKSMISLLLKARGAGYAVAITHLDNSAEATSVSSVLVNISPIGTAIHNDFYSVSGSAIPAAAVMVFESASAIVTVIPDLVRPHWAFVSQLPAAIPLGRNLLRLEAGGWSSDTVPVMVSPGPRVTRRVLLSGRPKSRPYTIVFVANPVIETESSSLIPDAILTDRPSFHVAVGFSLRNLLTRTEDLLRQADRDAEVRLVTVFDATLTVLDANALAHELIPDIMETRRNKLRPFVSRYGELADIVFVVHGSTTHGRASAWFTSDESGGPATAHSYDGAPRVHGHFPAIPGSATLPSNMDQTGMTPFHEFAHAASDFTNGMVVDLYTDNPAGGYVVNKKFRVSNTDPVPAAFGTYNGAAFGSDPGRDGLGYPATWRSYHPVPIDPTRPNVMDNYWLAFDDPQRCRLDQLTYRWLTDRLRAKLER